MPEPKTRNFTVKLEIVDAWCKGCDLCVAFCPKDVLELRRGLAVVKDLEKCTACNICELMCPDFAIKVIKERLDGAADDDDAEGAEDAE
jgi:NAD-dependent dihydropyrimidine dehydrogenase PreA subunit